MQSNSIFSDWLSASHISTKVQEDFGISFTDKIIIPVHDADGNFLFNKYRRSPLTEVGPKYSYDKGGKVTLYGWDKAKDHKTILITEGEKDCLVAWSHNIPAVTSTGGAMSFQEEWAELFKDKEVIICFDNDYAGSEGMVKVLDMIPHAKVLFIPDSPNVKDISDYAARGGNLHDLLRTSKLLKDISDVQQDRQNRIATFQSIHFHESYIKEHTKKAPVIKKRNSLSSDVVENAKAYPMTNMIEFKQNKACCPFHNEKTPSFTYYPENNTAYCFGCSKVADSIEIYQHIHNCSFKKAVEELNNL